MAIIHRYPLDLTWTGNLGSGTSSYKGYSRNHVISAVNKNDISGSADPSFRGDLTRYNPEELLVASISSCHMLWYLHLCSQAGVILTAYQDHAVGYMIEHADGSGAFERVVLHPVVTVRETGMKDGAAQLHERANKLCFIANSVRFPVLHEPDIRVQNR